MALITCPDCGKPVSDQAGSCIHCGRPMHADLAGKPAAGSANAARKGAKAAKWQQDLGNAIGGLGFAFGLVVMLAGAPVGGIITMVVTVAIGVWIAYF